MSARAEAAAAAKRAYTEGIDDTHAISDAMDALLAHGYAVVLHARPDCFTVTLKPLDRVWGYRRALAESATARAKTLSGAFARALVKLAKGAK